MRPLIIRFLCRLEVTVGKMVRHLSERNFDALEQVCGDVSGTAGGYGYPDLQDLISGLQLLCQVKSPIEQISRHLDELVRQTEAAMVVRQAALSK